ncbi:MAG TPA: prepilin-type N-terminal cleavage/methylation domain-containing protein [Myxococcota bacterium]
MQRRSKWNRSGPRGGFTLLEVMLALSILAFGLLGLAAMQLYAMQGRSSGRHSTFAATLVQTQMDELQRRNWNTVTDTGGAWISAARGNVVVDASGNQTEQAYTLSWRITDDVVGVTRRLDVRATWIEEGGADRAYALSSIRYNRENL